VANWIAHPVRTRDQSRISKKSSNFICNLYRSLPYLVLEEIAMGGIKDIVEPGRKKYLPPSRATSKLIEIAVIVVLFTIGTLINYRPPPRGSNSSEEPLLRPRLIGPEQKRETRWTRIFPDNSRFRDNISSRFLARFPFLIEIWYWNLAYWIYQVSRAITAVKIRGNDDVFEAAKNHAVSILSLEEVHHFAIEQGLQAWVLRTFPSLISVLAAVYHSHIIVSVAFIVYTYTYLARHLFQHIRRSMALCNFLAFTILSIYRVMPPRMLPPSYGFQDILHPDEGDSGSSWTHNKFQLTIAAMPSLHFGISALIAYSLIRWAPHTWLRLIAILWPAAMLFTILATANHFVLDAAAGALVPIVAFLLSDVLLVLRPVEEWAFRLCRTEKPAAADQDPVSVGMRERA
jgi:hypothetical protein